MQIHSRLKQWQDLRTNASNQLQTTANTRKSAEVAGIKNIPAAIERASEIAKTYWESKESHPLMNYSRPVPQRSNTPIEEPETVEEPSPPAEETPQTASDLSTRLANYAEKNPVVNRIMNHYTNWREQNGVEDSSFEPFGMYLNRHPQVARYAAPHMGYFGALLGGNRNGKE